MGLLDTAKLVRKAQQTRSSMKQVQVAGRSKSGRVAVLLNGLNDLLEAEIDDELFQSGNKATLEQELIEAYQDAKKELEKALASTMDMDSIRDMFS